MINKIRFILGLPFAAITYICFIPIFIFGILSSLIYGKDYPFITTDFNKNK